MRDCFLKWLEKCFEQVGNYFMRFPPWVAARRLLLRVIRRFHGGSREMVICETL
jgi:hypothetical protein